MTKVTLVLIATLTLSGCSLATDAIKSAFSDDGMSIDAQVGSNENKVKTGVGAINGKTSTVDNETESGSISSDSGEWHIESERAVNITVYETGGWLYALLGLMFLVSIFRPWLVRKLGGTK